MIAARASADFKPFFIGASGKTSRCKSQPHRNLLPSAGPIPPPSPRRTKLFRSNRLLCSTLTFLLGASPVTSTEREHERTGLFSSFEKLTEPEPLTADSRVPTLIGMSKVECLLTLKTCSKGANLLEGTLDMRLRRAEFACRSACPWAEPYKSVRRTNGFLQAARATLSALHRLELRGCVISKWEMTPDRNRESSIIG